MELRVASPVALVVEDEWLWRQFVSDGLAVGGFAVIEATSGEHALELLYRDIDVLVGDIRLGGEVSGWDVAKEFRKTNPGMAVVYLSANPQEPALQVDGSVFLGRPCTMEELLAVCQILGRRRQEGAPQPWHINRISVLAE